MNPQAKSDTIDSLEPYRDKSMPTFLMYGVSPTSHRPLVPSQSPHAPSHHHGLLLCRRLCCPGSFKSVHSLYQALASPMRNQAHLCLAFPQGGVLVSVVRGALGPKLETTIRDKLAEEHEILDGKKERVTVSQWWLFEEQWRHCVCVCVCVGGG